jgi:hypothetical protein
MMQEAVIRIKRIIGKLARDNRMTLQVPLPVWDAGQNLIGVSLSQDTLPSPDFCVTVLKQDKRMGSEPCTASATFIFTQDEAKDEAKLKERAEAAIAALNNNILVSIRRKEVLKHAG